MNFLNPNSPQGIFRQHADGITRLIQEDGILFRPYSITSLPYFSSMSEQEQKDVLANTTATNEVGSPRAKNPGKGHTGKIGLLFHSRMVGSGL
jgi:hypothetical protein